MSAQAKNFADAKKDSFAQWLRDALHRRNLRPADVARDLRTQNSTVHRWLNGSVPHMHTLERIEKLLRMNYDHITEDAAQRVADDPPPRAIITEGRTDAAMLEELLTSMSDDKLRDVLDTYMIRAERDKEDRRAISMARLLLSEINLRAKAS